MTEYEYGIDWKVAHRRADTPHRSGMTLDEALAFMHPSGDKFNWYDVFVIIRREIGPWEPVGKQAPPTEDSETAAFFAIHEKPEHTRPCRCIKTPTGINTDIIGKDCGPGLNLNGCVSGCGRSAGTNGYCGPNGCYDVPG